MPVCASLGVQRARSCRSARCVMHIRRIVKRRWLGVVSWSMCASPATRRYELSAFPRSQTRLGNLSRRSYLHPFEGGRRAGRRVKRRKYGNRGYGRTYSSSMTCPSTGELIRRPWGSMRSDGMHKLDHTGPAIHGLGVKVVHLGLFTPYVHSSTNNGHF